MNNINAREWDITTDLPSPRCIQHVPTFGFQEGRGWRIFQIIEGRKGMTPTEIFCATYGDALKAAREANLAAGIPKSDIMSIQLYSMFTEDPSVAILAKQAQTGKTQVNEWGSDIIGLARAWVDKDFSRWLATLGDAHLLTYYGRDCSLVEVAANFGISCVSLAKLLLGIEVLRRMKHEPGNSLAA